MNIEQVILICVWYLLGVLVIGWCGYALECLTLKFNVKESGFFALFLTAWPVTAFCVASVLLDKRTARTYWQDRNKR